MYLRYNITFFSSDDTCIRLALKKSVEDVKLDAKSPWNSCEFRTYHLKIFEKLRAYTCTKFLELQLRVVQVDVISGLLRGD